MVKTILTAIDGSGHGGKALEFASGMAEKYDAQLFIVHVMGHGNVPPELVHMAEIEQITKPSTVDNSEPLASIPHGGLKSENAQIHTFIGEKLAEEALTIAKARGVKEVQTIVEPGDPAERILDNADKHKADVIVLGSRGLGNLKGLLLGSVSQKVNHLSDCTCVCVK